MKTYKNFIKETYQYTNDDNFLKDLGIKPMTDDEKRTPHPKFANILKEFHFHHFTDQDGMSHYDHDYANHLLSVNHNTGDWEVNFEGDGSDDFKHTGNGLKSLHSTLLRYNV